MKELFVATANEGKLKEFQNILTDFNIRSILDLENPPEIVEDGFTFRQNAIKKAEFIFNYSKVPTVADDSGLVVDYLEGAPGVNSARFLGEKASDEKRNKKILLLMENAPDDKRTASFFRSAQWRLVSGRHLSPFSTFLRYVLGNLELLQPGQVGVCHTVCASVSGV